MHRYALDAPSGRFGFGRAAAAPAKDSCTGVVAAPAPAGPGGRRSGQPALAAGEYSVRLTVDGQSYTQPVTIKQDPRIDAGRR
jgi:hypothetical protein